MDLFSTNVNVVLEEDELEELVRPNTSPLPSCQLRWDEAFAKNQVESLIVMESCFSSLIDSIRENCQVPGTVIIDNNDPIELILYHKSLYVVAPSDTLQMQQAFMFLLSEFQLKQISALCHATQGLPNDEYLTKISFPPSEAQKQYMIGLSAHDVAGLVLTLARAHDIYGSVIMVQTYAVSIATLIENLLSMGLNVPTPKDLKKGDRLIASQAAPLSMYI